MARKRKKKPLILVAGKCEDRQWRDYREAVYPLLLKFGFFDQLHTEGSPEQLSSGHPPVASLPLPREQW